MLKELKKLFNDERGGYYIGGTLCLDDPMPGIKCVGYNTRGKRCWVLIDGMRLPESEREYFPSEEELKIVEEMYERKKAKRESSVRESTVGS